MGKFIVGFGTYHYVHQSGREGDTVVIGFSPRKDALSIYLMGGIKHVSGELAKLGKHRTGGGCLYIKSLGDIDTLVLRRILIKACKLTKPT